MWEALTSLVIMKINGCIPVVPPTDKSTYIKSCKSCGHLIMTYLYTLICSGHDQVYIYNTSTAWSNKLTFYLPTPTCSLQKQKAMKVSTPNNRPPLLAYKSSPGCTMHASSCWSVVYHALGYCLACLYSFNCSCRQTKVHPT